MQARSLGQEDPLEKEMATYFSILAREISWTKEPGGLQSMGLSRQEYWNRLPFPSPGDLPNIGIEPGSPALAGEFFNHLATRKAVMQYRVCGVS